MSWNFVRHAFLMIFRNLGNALKVTVGPIVLLIIFGVVLGLVTGVSVDASGQVLSDGTSAFVTGIAVALFIAAVLFAFSWVAVAWHRFVLLEEYPALLPPIMEKPIAAYAVQSIKVTLMVILVALPIMFIVVLVSGPAVLIFGGVADLLIGAVIGALLSYFSLRWGLILPAAAVGQPMILREAWDASAPHSKTIFGISAIMVGLNIVVSIVSLIFAAGLPPIAWVIDLGMSWLMALAGISIITALYGHIVQGRPLSE